MDTAFSKRTGSLVLLFIFYVLSATGQEHKYEAGVATGVVFYLGDANPHHLFNHTHPAVGIQFRYNLNFRWAVKAHGGFGKVSGSIRGYPQEGITPVAFKRTFIDTGIQAEFNFSPYSDKFSYKSTSRLTPFILGGIGWTVDPWSEKTLSTFNMPLGAGVKYKIKHRINLAAELSFRKLFTDALDVTGTENSRLKDPYEIKSWIIKNKDWYVMCLISVTYDLGIRNRYCR